MFEKLIDNADVQAAPAFRVGAHETCSYAQMGADIRRCAAWLRKIGVDGGSRAVLHRLNPYLHWVLFFALESRGVVSIGQSLQPALGEPFLRYLGADLVFSSQPNANLPGVRWSTVDNGFVARMRAFRPQPMPPIARQPGDPICIVLSSGTTGIPKKVLLTRELLDRRTVHARGAGFLSEHARLACLLPFDSIGGILAGLQT